MDKLVSGLLPALKTNPPQHLLDQISGKPTADLLKRYLKDRLGSTFPKAEDLIGEMKLGLAFKGVTYETLTDAEFQDRVRKAYPYEDFTKPFEEFDAARATQERLSL